MTAEQERYQTNKDYREGWDKGFQQGAKHNSTILKQKYELGYDEGRRVGYTIGYNAGYEAAEKKRENIQKKLDSAKKVPIVLDALELRARNKKLEETVKKQYKIIQKLKGKNNG